MMMMLHFDEQVPSIIFNLSLVAVVVIVVVLVLAPASAAAALSSLLPDRIFFKLYGHRFREKAGRAPSARPLAYLPASRSVYTERNDGK